MVCTLVLTAVLSSCDAGTGGTAPFATGAYPIVLPVWYMWYANDSTLPATISVRLIGVAQEETVLDSARLTVNRDGSYSQRYAYRVFVTGVLDRSDFVLDEGTWTVTGASYTFSSSVRSRTFSVTVPRAGELSSTEPMLFFSSAPITTGTYRLLPP